jgi:dephospho-CoA kinase
MAGAGTKPTDKRILVVGVAGIMGAGKSTVARVFEEEGAKRIDADRLGRELLTRGKIKDEIVKVFGRGVLTRQGGIDTAKLARVAFRDAESVAELDRITRAALIDRIKGRIEKLGREGGVVVVDAALLPEWDSTEWIDVLVVVDSDEKSAVGRASAAARFEPAGVRARMKHQMPRRAKSMKADIIIPNFGSLEDLRQKARIVFRKLQGAAGKE